MRWSWLSLGLCLLAGCQETPTTLLGNGGDGRDVGASDEGERDGVVVGPRDMGRRDAGAPADAPTSPDILPGDLPGDPPRGCGGAPRGTNGCGCNSTRAPDSPRFLQDDCNRSLLCVDWDNLAGRDDLTGSFQSCVQPCVTDANCNPGWQCRPSGLNRDSGAEKVCVERIAGFDEYCGFSRLTHSVDPDPAVQLQTRGEIVGCGDEAACVRNVAAGQTHVSEGICLGLCESNADCQMPTPFCNVDQVTLATEQGTLESAGVCQPQLYQLGQLCGSSDPNKLGITSGCDNGPGARADNQICVGLGGLFDEGLGTCLSTCNAAEPCTGGSRCVPGFFVNGDGVCSEDCTNFPESCPAVGGEANLGFVCFAIHRLFDLQGDEVSLCMDRLAPALTSTAVLDIGTGQLTTLGDNCWAAGGSNNFLRCPWPTFCEVVDFQNGQGTCLTGCSTMSSPDCPAITGVSTSMCADVFMNATSGICGF